MTFNLATWFVDRHLEEGRGERTALLTGEREVSYAELAALVNRAGHVLRDLGVRQDAKLTAAFARVRRDGYSFTIMPRSGRLQGIGVAIRKDDRVMGCLSMRFIRSAMTEREAGMRYGAPLNLLAEAIAENAER